MEQKEYLKAKVEERKAQWQPSKQHKQPAVIGEPETKKPLYREQL